MHSYFETNLIIIYKYWEKKRQIWKFIFCWFADLESLEVANWIHWLNSYRNFIKSNNVNINAL